MDEANEAILIPIISTAIILLLATVITMGVFIQQKRRQKYREELVEMKSLHERSLLEIQLRTQQETFRAISENLHDSVGSQISTAMLLLYKVEGLRDDEHEANRAEAISILDTVVDDLKNIARSLNAGYLENIGLKEAIRQRLDQLQRTKRYEIQYTCNEPMALLEQQKQVVLYYVFQEAISNISQHAFATRIEVALDFKTDSLYLSIKDNGKGIGKAFNEGAQAKGNGLINMKNHAAMLSGKFDLITDATGTEIVFNIPDPYLLKLKT